MPLPNYGHPKKRIIEIISVREKGMKKHRRESLHTQSASECAPLIRFALPIRIKNISDLTKNPISDLHFRASKRQGFSYAL